VPLRDADATDDRFAELRSLVVVSDRRGGGLGTDRPAR
jgi:hypothetical protein